MAPREKLRPKLLKLVRRIHLYLGLLLVPWVVLFGITALSFNHPGMFRKLEGRMVPPPEFKELTGFAPWQAETIAQRVVDGMNENRTDGERFELETESSKFHGWALFVSPSPNGQNVVIVGLDRGMGIVTHRPAAPQSTKPPFMGQEVSVEGFRSADIAEQLQDLPQKLHLEAQAPFKPHPAVHPGLRFVVRDAQGKKWNVEQDLTTGKLDGRPREEGHRAATIELLESMHTQHHFPPSLGPTTFWALFADLTAFTMLMWALTGLVMWWQMRKLRIVGGIVLVTALGLAYVVMTSTASDLQFGAERASAEN